MGYPVPSNVGFYAVAREHGRTRIVDGPHSPTKAHRQVEVVRKAALERNLSFPDVGVLRVTVKPGQTLPVHTASEVG